MAKLDNIFLFPIKSLDPVAVQEVNITAGGALQGDREFALFDQEGKYINAKRYPSIHRIRANYQWEDRLVGLRVPDQSPTYFHLDRDRAELEDWFSHFFAQPVELRRNSINGFPDDPRAWGATIVSQASLLEAQSWYNDHHLELDDIRRRFRTNLEIADVIPFWEDSLFGKDTETVSFQIGDVQFLGTNPCQRCPVPTRDPLTGDPYANFQKIFSRERATTISTDVERSRFKHFYYFALNTRIPISEAGKILKVGDRIAL
ncbi:MAG: MOSC N-terminal beta barrel domain-containing protein [Pseudanabaenaceae cyanobacterium bins.39]|nr:MOSC N-terminal beta barrel domain-containing protein [Pseudanabaenaceae cyanobacterium bins.39]